VSSEIKKLTIFPFILLFLILAALACGQLESGYNELPQNIVVNSTQNENETIEADDIEEQVTPQYRTDNILFQDDFSNPNSGWDRFEYPTGITDYFKNGYKIIVQEPYNYLWATPYKVFKDVSIEVDIKKVRGEDDNNFGVICRHKDTDNFYALVISSDGYYGIRKRTNGGEANFIGSEGMQSSPAIKLKGFNHLRADCIGENLSIYVNGELLLKVKDSAISSGDVGLFAGTFETNNTEILFKNFVVYLPK
jgi:hypothetical protein